MSFDSRRPYGLAALDYFNGDTSATFFAYDELGQRHERPVSLFFRKAAEFPVWEKEALRLCRGRILDVGAGVGRHSLVLQERGFSVCAIEVVPECVEIMKKRGVTDCYCVDVLAFSSEPFDTVLCLMNGVGMAGSLNALKPFLTSISRLTKQGGQLLIDSMDLRQLPEVKAILEEKAESGQYFGEMGVQLEYNGIKGEPFKELYVEPDLLCEIASSSGWRCQIILREAKGRYLAQLTPA
jgi:SAM-dependent methyltransferase